MNQILNHPSAKLTLGEKLRDARERLDKAVAELAKFAPKGADGQVNPNYDGTQFMQALAKLQQESLNHQKELAEWNAGQEYHTRRIEEYMNKRGVFFNQAVDHGKWVVIIAGGLFGLSLELYRFFAQRGSMSCWEKGSYELFLVCMFLTVLGTLAARFIYTHYEEICVRQSLAHVDLNGTQLQQNPDKERIRQLADTLTTCERRERCWRGCFDWASRLFIAANVSLVLGIVSLLSFVVSNL